MNEALKDIVIRDATIDDMPAVCALVRDLAIYEKAEKEMWLDPDDYINFFRKAHFKSLVAEDKEGIVGMMIYYPTFSTWKGPMLHLEDFNIKEDRRRSGIGQLMMDRFLSIAKKENVVLVKWEVLDWNTPAIDFYKKYKAIFDTDWWNVKIILKPRS